MVAEAQRRFRRRGGAKKKKKPREDPAPHPPTPTNDPSVPSTDAPAPATPQHPPAPPTRYASASDRHTTLDADLQAYLQRLHDDLHSLDPTGVVAQTYAAAPDDDDDPPPAVLLARNALAALSGRMHELARDNAASRLLETLLAASVSAEAVAVALTDLLALGAARFAALALHHSGSHVLEAMLRLLRGARGADVYAALEGLAEAVALWRPGELVDVMQNSSGSHVFRVIVAMLAGLPEEEPREAKLDDSVPGKINTYIQRMAVEVPDVYHEKLQKLANTLLEHDSKLDLSSLLWRPAPCTALQGLLSAVVVSDRELAARLAETAIKDHVDNLMYNACGSRFIERTVLCLGADIVKETFKGRLKELAQDPKANFCVQRVLLSMRGRGSVMNAWDELEESIPHMLGFGKAREGVVLSLLRVTEAEGDENCRRRASRCIARACGAVGTTSKLLAGVLAMGSAEAWRHWQANVENVGRAGLGCPGRAGDSLRLPRSIPGPGLLGTLMARCVMRFPGGPGQSIRDSMATLSDLEILALSGDASGSRLIEQWVASDNGRIASKVMNAIAGESETFGILAAARSPYGAQIIVKSLQLLQGAHRKRIMEALASDFGALRNHPNGQIVVRKCRVEQYMRRGEQWENEESTKETRHRLFADILNDSDEDDDGGDSTARKSRKDKSTKAKKGKKRKRKEEDEIPANISEPVTNMPADVQPSNVVLVSTADVGDENRDAGLGAILGAIEQAGEQVEKKKKKKKKRSKASD